MEQVSEQLITDHAALGEVLTELHTALQSGDLKNAFAKLDLFWARLAVHIRAEHLHLFPTVLRSLENAEVEQVAPSLEHAQAIIAELREDHDFFMHQLALAVEIMRESLTLSEQPIAPERKNNVKRIVLEVEQRLIKHNELEEGQLYRWTTTLLNSEEQAKLANEVTTELLKHPARFTPSTWSNE
jgi:hypothetical protein